MREKLNKIRAAVESGRLHELMRGEASSSLKRAGSVAAFDRKATIQWFGALTDAELANVWQYANDLVKARQPSGPWKSKKPLNDQAH